MDYLLLFSQVRLAKKKKIPTDNVVGAPWGAIFEVKGNKLELCNEVPPEMKDSEDLPGIIPCILSVSQYLLINKVELQTMDEEDAGEDNEDKDDKEEQDDEDGEEDGEKSTAKKTSDGVQKLTQEAITDMKEKGASGRTIIKALMKNSTSFQDKSVFSQQKYIRKKRNK